MLRLFRRCHIQHVKLELCSGRPTGMCSELLVRLKHSDFEKKVDEPVSYSQSRAAAWTARQSNTGGAGDEAPWFQTYAVTFSLAVFLLYFLFLREESDIDDVLQSSLYDQIPGLERKQLEVALKYNEQHGLETAALEKRLDEIKKEGVSEIK